MNVLEYVRFLAPRLNDVSDEVILQWETILSPQAMDETACLTPEQQTLALAYLVAHAITEAAAASDGGDDPGPSGAIRMRREGELEIEYDAMKVSIGDVSVPGWWSPERYRTTYYGKKYWELASKCARVRGAAIITRFGP